MCEGTDLVLALVVPSSLVFRALTPGGPSPARQHLAAEEAGGSGT